MTDGAAALARFIVSSEMFWFWFILSDDTRVPHLDPSEVHPEPRCYVHTSSAETKASESETVKAITSPLEVELTNTIR